MGIEYVDGRRFARAVIAGAEWVRHTREALNRINVFPVPDGDTGTNMALSLCSAAGAVRGLEERHLGTVSERVAEASILGAKGNSGVILAHWFQGLSRAVAGRARVDAAGLAGAMEVGARCVYGALEKPVEGTILTVMREAAGRAKDSARSGSDVEALLDDVLAAAEGALARTREMLEVLGRAGVVDAGAAGWVNFMKGVRRAIRGEPAPEDPAYGEEDLGGTAAAGVALSLGHPVGEGEGELGERYCVEILCRGRNRRFGAPRLRRIFAGAGSHLIVVTTGRVFRLHVHTDDPEEVLRKAEKLGRLEERKVDDMLRQREERAGGRGGADAAPGLPPADDQPGTVAVLCDSTADLPEELRRAHGIGMVPLQVLFGGEVFRDQVDLDSEEFYRRLAAGGRPTTSQPPPRAFVEALECVRRDREVVVLTLSAALSGTYASAMSGARLAQQPRVEVVDSGSASLGLGLQVLGAARLAARGAGVDAILAQLARWREATGVVFTVASLEHLRRGGRIGLVQGLVGELLGLRPVLAFERGKMRAVGRARGDEEAFEKVLAELRRRVPEGARVRFGIVEADRPEAAARAERRLRERYEVVELVRGEFTGVVGAHTGPGTWGVVWQRVG